MPTGANPTTWRNSPRAASASPSPRNESELLRGVGLTLAVPCCESQGESCPEMRPRRHQVVLIVVDETEDLVGFDDQIRQPLRHSSRQRFSKSPQSDQKLMSHFMNATAFEQHFDVLTPAGHFQARCPRPCATRSHRS
jgi:hypothetical protein